MSANLHHDQRGVAPEPVAEQAAPDAATWRAIVSRGDLRFRVVSTSMLPTLLPGDTVLLQPLTGPPLAGEIVAFFQAGKLVVHRHLGNGVFRGDNRLVADEPVAEADWVGRVSRRWRGNREFPLTPNLGLAARWNRCRLHAGVLDRAGRRVLVALLRRLGLRSAPPPRRW